MKTRLTVWIITIAQILMLPLQARGQEQSTPPKDSSTSSHIVIFRHFSLKNGLPDRIVKDIDQDEGGFIWLSTNEGLVRWDGHRFKHFSRKQYDLPFRGVMQAAVSPDGWFLLFPIREGFELDSAITEGWIGFDPKTGQTKRIAAIFPK